ncbi:SUKH-4 family immunity protein [Vibrio europaeus]|uniref:SUKH-4 family immunity protein n=1 Tax=Vibrio europaeus TaxID=300876 RepID=UPI00233E76DB|nr:SUKH-4 family immunity protein [Vibrio europaeus]MDC5857458.1 SUKH-4 family immunity protein [Vibrio europaeus]
MEVSRFLNSILKFQDVPIKTSKYLVEVGLPNWCAPHLYFGGFEEEYLPQLKGWCWACDWSEGYDSAVSRYPNARVLGSAMGNVPIILLPNNPKVFVFDNKGCELLFLNSDVQSLSRVIANFESIIESAVSEDQDAFINKTIPRALISCFIDEIRGIEQSSTVWSSWAEACGKNA